MNKKTKVLLGVGAVALLLYIISKSKNNSQCALGEFPCNTGNGKCYDPNVNYKVDPCQTEIMVY